MSVGLSDEMVWRLGGTGAGGAALELMVAQQRRRRLLTLRGLLEAVREAPAGSLPDGVAERVLLDWQLLEAADRADPEAAGRVVNYAQTGAWAERCLRALTLPELAGSAAARLPHLAAIAAAAAGRAGMRFSTDVPVHAGVLVLPTLGSHPAPGAHRVRVDGDGSRLWLHLRGPAADLPRDHGRRHPAAGGPVEVRRGPDGVWRSAAPGWHPLRALWTTDARPVLIDDADPYRDDDRRTNPYGLTAAPVLDAAEHARWRSAWQDAQPWLRLGDGSRALETARLLDCIVPLSGSRTAHCSATRSEAFGALLSSTPRSGLELAATLVHELQHTKLLALSELTVLHTADDSPSYWAPWRPDPRPLYGLLQGAYAHLALADFQLGVALTAAAPAARRDTAWADHCRCRQQVEHALPQLLGSSRLTASGRTLVNAMAAHHTRLKEHSPPDGHLARAQAYVETARAIWRRQRT